MPTVTRSFSSPLIFRPETEVESPNQKLKIPTRNLARICTARQMQRPTGAGPVLHRTTRSDRPQRPPHHLKPVANRHGRSEFLVSAEGPIEWRKFRFWWWRLLSWSCGAGSARSCARRPGSISFLDWERRRNRAWLVGLRRTLARPISVRSSIRRRWSWKDCWRETTQARPWWFWDSACAHVSRALLSVAGMRRSSSDPSVQILRVGSGVMSPDHQSVWVLQKSWIEGVELDSNGAHFWNSECLSLKRKGD